MYVNIIYVYFRVGSILQSLREVIPVKNKQVAFLWHGQHRNPGISGTIWEEYGDGN